MPLEHTFSPIISEERLHAATEYVVAQSIVLARTVLQRELGVDTVCFFTRSPEEYSFLRQAVLRRGPKSRLSHGQTLYTDTNFTVLGQTIQIFGVRQPDDSRPQIGYGDYPVTDYGQLLQMTLANPYMKEIISGRGQSLIELRHPDFDILGFVVDAATHK